MLSFIGMIIASVYYVLERGFLQNIQSLFERYKEIGQVAHSLDMVVAYNILLIFYLYLYYKFHFFIPNEIINISNKSIIIIGLSLLFLGRIITKTQGANFGRDYFKGLLFYRVFFIVLIVYLINDLGELSYSSLYKEIDAFMNFYNGLPVESIPIGIAFMVIVGESVLYLIKPGIITLNDLSSFIPIDFQLMRKGKLNGSFQTIIKSKDIKSIKIISNSEVFIRWILDSPKDIGLLRGTTFIIRAPSEDLVANHKEMLSRTPFSLGDFFGYKAYKSNEFSKEITNHEKKLRYYGDLGYLALKFKYLGSINLIVIEKSKGDNKALISFSLYDNDGPVICTQSQQLVHLLSSIFDKIWDDINIK